MFSVFCEYFSYITLFHPHNSIRHITNFFFNGVLERYKHNPWTEQIINPDPGPPDSHLDPWRLSIPHTANITSHREEQAIPLHTSKSQNIQIAYVCGAWILPEENTAQSVHYSTMPTFHNHIASIQVIKRMDFKNNERADSGTSSVVEPMLPCIQSGVPPPASQNNYNNTEIQHDK